MLFHVFLELHFFPPNSLIYLKQEALCMKLGTCLLNKKSNEE